MRIRWAQCARADLRGLEAYIAKDSPVYARRFVARIIESIDKLTDHPFIGRPVPEAEREDVRELIYRGYRIIYLTQTDQLFIVAVIHGARDLGGRQIKPWEIV